MSRRKTPLVTEEIYHIYNRAVVPEKPFFYHQDCLRAMQAIYFYRYAGATMRLSRFMQYSKKRKQNYFKNKKEGDKLVIFLAYCLMPNHYHFLLKQKQNNGISKFIGDWQNSYARYFNIKKKRTGVLFQTKFKSVRIESNEQLLHVSRYIHLNPYTSHLIKDIQSLAEYKWSSYQEYLGKAQVLVEKEMVLGQFKDKKQYESFVNNQAEYQRKLNQIKNLIFD